MHKYTPISCSFYDFLEEAATFSKEVDILIVQDGKEVLLKQVIVKDLQVRNGEEFMFLSNGTSYRLDRIRVFDGKELSGNCDI